MFDTSAPEISPSVFLNREICEPRRNLFSSTKNSGPVASVAQYGVLVRALQWLGRALRCRTPGRTLIPSLNMKKS